MRTDRVLRVAAVAVLAATLLACALPAHAQRSGDSIVVSPRGPVSTVAAALAQAKPGDRIVVLAGTYREPMIVVNTKRLTIEGRDNPVIDAQGTHQIMAVMADSVTVRGLTLRNVGTSYVEDRAAIKVARAVGCSITDNRIEDGFFGIYLAGASYCTIARNEIHAHATDEAGAGNGIHLWSSNHVTIEDNHVSGHRDGIYFEFVKESTIRNNVSEHNLRYGLHFMFSDDDQYIGNTFRQNLAGVAVMFTHRVTMIGNRFEKNWGAASYGLLLKEIYDSRVEDNHFVGNTVGLFADGANRIHAEHNEFRDNGWAVKLMANTEEGLFTRNDFTGNTFDVATNSRQATTRFDGNYWSAYRGYDLNRDGRGDVPYLPVRLFSLVVEQNPPSLVLLRSVFVGALDAAERVLPSLTPSSLADAHPSMRPIP